MLQTLHKRKQIILVFICLHGRHCGRSQDTVLGLTIIIFDTRALFEPWLPSRHSSMTLILIGHPPSTNWVISHTIHFIFGRVLFLTFSGLNSIILLANSFSSSGFTSPAYCNLRTLVVLAISDNLYKVDAAHNYVLFFVPFSLHSSEDDPQ